MSLTEVGRLAIGKNCFRCAVKDATSYGITSYSKNICQRDFNFGLERVETF